MPRRFAMQNVKNTLFVESGDIITARADMTPVLCGPNISDPELMASFVANFLRLGCPAVQCIDRSNNRLAERAKAFLDALSQGVEKFELTTWPVDDDDKFTIARFTRHTDE